MGFSRFKFRTGTKTWGQNVPTVGSREFEPVEAKLYSQTEVRCPGWRPVCICT